jgi:hypothetical protein
MNLKLLLTAAAAALAISAQAQASTVYNFWFSNDGTAGGNVEGTVYGKIYGLDDDYVGGASKVVILKNPGVAGLPSTPFTVEDYATDLGLFLSQNFFVVNNSHVDFAIYQIFGGYFDINVPCCGVFFNSLVSPDVASRVQNTHGMGENGVRFDAAPEPATWALMIGGFGLAGASLRRRKPAVV